MDLPGRPMNVVTDAIMAGIAAAVAAWTYMPAGRARNLAVAVILIGGFFLYRGIFDPAVERIEAFDPATHGNVGGFGLNSIWAWPVVSMT